MVAGAENPSVAERLPAYADIWLKAVPFGAFFYACVRVLTNAKKILKILKGVYMLK